MNDETQLIWLLKTFFKGVLVILNIRLAIFALSNTNREYIMPILSWIQAYIAIYRNNVALPFNLTCNFCYRLKLSKLGNILLVRK